MRIHEQRTNELIQRLDYKNIQFYLEKDFFQMRKVRHSKEKRLLN
jgi:hypothetical protein